MLSALLGIGGAVVTTPAVRVLGATPIEAVGSTVPAILPGAISGAYRYTKAGLVDWTLALSLGISGAVFALGGAWVSDLVDGRLLMVLTAVLMLWSGVSVVRGGDRAEVAGRSGGRARARRGRRPTTGNRSVWLLGGGRRGIRLRRRAAGGRRRASSWCRRWPGRCGSR